MNKTEGMLKEDTNKVPHKVTVDLGKNIAQELEHID